MPENAEICPVCEKLALPRVGKDSIANARCCQSCFAVIDCEGNKIGYYPLVIDFGPETKK